MSTVTFESGSKMPVNGFGIWRVEPAVVMRALRTAFDVGYRHIDSAMIYMNEPEAGKVFEEYFGGDSPKVKREDVFITSKLWNSCHAKDKVVEACRKSLEDLKLDYLDLYLVHFPISWKCGGLPLTENNWLLKTEDGYPQFTTDVSLKDTWEGMEECVRLGLVKNIGVSNYPVFSLCDLMNYCKIKPAVNQCECHVMNQREDLRKVCNKFGIHYTAYSILGSGKSGPLEDETVLKIAEKHGASPAQICIAWGLAQGVSVLAKSSTDSRIKSNFAAEKIKLSENDLKELKKLDKGLCVCDPKEYWGFPALA